MKVAIWGSYAYGNYGDELMALQFALFLRQAGVQPVVFGLDARLAQLYALDTADSADALIRDASFCVFGGGSLLSAHKQGPDWYQNQKEREYREFATALEKYQCPLYLSSIGGDGAFDTGAGIAPYREALLRSGLCKMATVRQEADVAVLQEKYGIEAHYYPDVLLSIRDFIDIPAGTGTKSGVHIGLNLPKAYRSTVALLEACSRLRGDFVFHVFHTVRRAPGRAALGGELYSRRESSRFLFHAYEDPADTLRHLSSLDVMVTAKLHIGLTGLAVGVPYICIGNSLKCKAFLYSIRAGFAYWGEKSPIEKRVRMLGLLSQRRVAALREQFNYAVLDEQTELSRGHLERLRSVFQNYSSSPIPGSSLPSVQGKV